MRMLFVHGAGAYDDDRPLAEALAAALDAELEMPELPSDDMSLEAWAAPIRHALADHDPKDPLVAHSFGASVLLKVLAERDWPINKATLLAMPDWSPEGWNVADYAFTGPEPAVVLSLHHCRDDEVVPFEHLALNARRLPSATLHEHPTGGHQLNGLAQALASAIP